MICSIFGGYFVTMMISFLEIAFTTVCCIADVIYLMKRKGLHLKLVSLGRLWLFLIGSWELVSSSTLFLWSISDLQKKLYVFIEFGDGIWWFSSEVWCTLPYSNPLYCCYKKNSTGEGMTFIAAMMTTSSGTLMTCVLIDMNLLKY